MELSLSSFTVSLFNVSELIIQKFSKFDHLLLKKKVILHKRTLQGWEDTEDKWLPSFLDFKLVDEWKPELLALNVPSKS